MGHSEGGAYVPLANYVRHGGVDTGGTYIDATFENPTITNPTISGDLGTSDEPLRLIGEGQSVLLVDTPAGGALYGEDIAETYSLGAWDPYDASGLTQRFLYGMFQTLYALTITVTNIDGSNEAQVARYDAGDNLVHLGGGRVTVFDNAATLTGMTYANRPSTPVAGTMAYFTDSTTVTWGATIAGGSSNKVLGWYNGSNWTVFGK